MRDRIPACLLTLAMTLCAAGCGAASRASSTNGPSARGRSDALVASDLYVVPDNPAAQEVAQLRGEGEAGGAAAVERIATQPTGNWFTEGPNVEAGVRALTRRASAAGRGVLLVAYYIPGRDCGGYSSGGAPSPAAYMSWIRRFAAGIGARRATVILEPDAIAQALTGCLNAAETRERYTLLRFAVGVLKAHPQVGVYVDAGNLGWIEPSRRLAAPLRRAGIVQADGFSLNVSNFYATEPTIAYGTALSKVLGGTHFVIDTGRNGNGPLGNARNPLDWCNPTGRALGATPGTQPASPLVDAYLWVKQPGMSDGSCRPGEPRAGRWWPQYALALAGG
jgi:endoglucanase